MKQIVRMLILEDDMDMHDMVRDLFRRNGIPTIYEFYYDPKLFLKDFDDNVHVAIIDHLLPGINGFEIVNEIYKLVASSPTRLAGCQIIILSGQKNYDVLLQYHRMGVLDYISKDEKDEKGKYTWERQLIKTTKAALELSYYWLNHLKKWSGGILNPDNNESNSGDSMVVRALG